MPVSGGMKTKKKTTKKPATVVTPTSTTNVPKTIREQIEQTFFKVVLKKPFAKIPKDKTLKDYAMEVDAKWADDYVQLFMDNIYMDMNIQLPKTYAKKTVKEILDYIEKQKRGQIFHGWK
jgi:hypothetical protein